MRKIPFYASIGLLGLLAAGGLNAPLCAATAEATVKPEHEVNDGKIPENPANPPEGMEIGTWSMELWGNPGTSEIQRVAKKRLMKLIYTSGDKGKAAFKHTTGMGVALDGKFRCWVYAPTDKSPDISIALSTSQAYLWNESKSFPLKKGWNVIEVPFAKNNWKTQASEWKIVNALDHPDDVRAVTLCVMNGNTNGWLLVQGLQADPDETGKKVDKLMVDLLADDFEKRAAAELGLIALGRPAIESLSQGQSSERPEVMMRASFALKKVLAVPEPLPVDPAIKETLLKQREASNFREIRMRVNYALGMIKNEKERMLKQAKESKDTIATGKTDLAALQYTLEEDKKAFELELIELEQLSKEVIEKFDIPPAPKPDAMVKPPVK